MNRDEFKKLYPDVFSEDEKTVLMEFNKKLIESQKPLEPEFEKVFWDNYWDLLA